MASSTHEAEAEVPRTGTLPRRLLITGVVSEAKKSGRAIKAKRA
jgi:hypothetical protein